MEGWLWQALCNEVPYSLDLKVILLQQCNSTHPTVWEKKSKIGFQDGS